MHRSFEITVPASESAALAEELSARDEVISVAVLPRAGIKPEGDVLSVHALNRGADEVLAAVDRVRVNGEISVTSSEVASIIDPAHEQEVADDLDEGIWEDIETSLRNHSRISFNYAMLMLLGGGTAAAGLFSTDGTLAIAMVACAVIAPGFEPVAKISLGIALRRAGIAGRGLRSFLIGYALIAAAGAIVALVLTEWGPETIAGLRDNPMAHEVAYPSAAGLVISACGAVAGGVTIAAQRLPLLPGPLIALSLIPATALVGMAAAGGDGDLAARALGRMGIDVGFVLVAVALVFGYKQAAVHRRRPMV